MAVRVAILVAEDPYQGGVDILAKAHSRLGHQVSIVHLSQLITSSDYLIRFPDHLLPDIAHSRASALWGIPVQKEIEMVIPIINSTAGQLAGRDKWVCARKLAAARVPAIRTMLISPGTTAEQVFETVGGDVVMKPLTGYRGQGVIRCHGRAEIIQGLARAEELAVAQPFHQVGGRKMRIIVIGGEVVAAVERQAPPGEFLAVGAPGEVAQAVRPSEECQRLALKAAAVTDLDIAGVDLIETVDGPLVVEVNTNAGGLEKMHYLTGVDVAGAMAAYVGGLVQEPRKPGP